MKNKPKKCKLCGTPTRLVYNIKFRAVPICEDCGRSITVQQVHWWVRQDTEK